jgi:hypothetical protein
LCLVLRSIDDIVETCLQNADKLTILMS